MRTITIVNLQCRPNHNGLTNVVESVIYQVTDTVEINGETHEVNGAGVAHLPNPNPAEFIPFETLAESTVIAWVEANADINGLVARLTDQLTARLNPPIVSLTPPWQS